ncbi:S-layer homology domain-containing protein [Fontibacillus phaseoli]|uniref:S-layer homology domain-containing protein n=1 Tax=Fontibacillus phaseoli TaxID=1416533 RepID=UPI001FE51B79|nr:S-layer homology domain-containing protein [Fontibacillus phaseoli]
MPFRDIESSYAREAIVRLNSKQIMNGTSDYLFSPAKPITRAEFVITMNRMLGLESVASSVPSYKDVRKNHWFYSGVQAQTELGLTEGKGDGAFEPFQAVTRQEAAVWIIRILNERTGGTGPIAEYQDDSSIAVWARPYVSAITDLGLMKGSSGRFNPNRSLTRQETAVILDRLLQNSTWSRKLSAKAAPGIQMGWQFGQTDEQYKQSVLKSNVNVLSPRWFFLNEDGSVSDHSDPTLATWAKQKGKQVWALFGNRLNQENTQLLLSSQEKTAAAIAKIKNLAVKNGIHGINLDFENVAPSDRKKFTAFVTELARQLHANKMKLSVDVSPDLKTDWTEGFDYAALGKSADYIVLMGYDEHWSGGKAGSVSSLPWVQYGLDTLLKEVPASKVLLGLPLYVRDWEIDNKGNTLISEDLTLAEQIKRLNRVGAKPEWNYDLAQYTATYYSATAHRIWMEESRSLSEKYGMAKNRNIAGFAYWHIGGETPEIWPALRNAEKYSAVKSQ